MLVNFLMLLLLLALYVVCAALVYFADSIIRPLGEGREPRRDPLKTDAS